MVDLAPAVRRVDAIQSFVSQETPMVRVTASDGATGTGYSYTIGTGGPAVVSLIARTFAPALIGRDAGPVRLPLTDLSPAEMEELSVLIAKATASVQQESKAA